MQAVIRSLQNEKEQLNKRLHKANLNMIEKMAKGTKKEVSGEDFDEKEDYLFMK